MENTINTTSSVANTKDLWKILCENVKMYTSDREYKSWFLSATLEKIDGGIAQIACKSQYHREWLETYHRAIIRRTLKSITGEDFELSFVIKTDEKKDPDYLNTPLFSLPTKESSVDIEDLAKKAQLNPKYLFSNFIVGGHNKLAYAVAEAIVENPGKAYNPVFIYGPTGVGKTHLMQSIGNEILIRDRNKKIVYVSSEQFLNEFLQSIKGKTNEMFRKKYREIDVLMIDDIQFIESYQKTQEEIFNTFNTLYQANKQIILAADRPPREIKNLTDRLRSRFEGGMVVDIQAPDLETRLAILKHLFEEKNLSVDDEILNVVARNIESNVRELEGAVTKIVSMRKLGEDTNVERIAKALQFDIDSKRRRMRPEKVIDAVCEVFDVTHKEIKGKSRAAYIALARQVIMYLLREELELPLEKVAREVNRKDHTTVLHACEKIGDLVKEGGKIKEKIARCKELLS